MQLGLLDALEEGVVLVLAQLVLLLAEHEDVLAALDHLLLELGEEVFALVAQREQRVALHVAVEERVEEVPPGEELHEALLVLLHLQLLADLRLRLLHHANLRPLHVPHLRSANPFFILVFFFEEN